MDGRPGNVDARDTLALAKTGLERLGFEVAVDPHDLRQHGVKAVASRKRQTFAVAWAASIPFRRHDVRGALADAVLRLHRACAGRKLLPLVAVVVEKAGPTAAAEVESYMREYAPRASWLVVDRQDHGRWKIAGQAGEADWREVGSPSPSIMKPAVVSYRDPYSPAFQWLLKVLLLSGIERQYWGGPERAPVNIAELVRASGVSQPQVSVFVKQYEEAGYLRRGPRGFSFADVRRVLDGWSVSVRHKNGERQPVQLLYPAANQNQAIAGILAKLRVPGEIGAYAVGSHLGCHLLGLRRSNVRSLRLYVGRPIADWERLLDLVPADAGDAALELVRPRARASVFRGARSAKGIVIADVLQCYLDVMQSPARGAEQAEHLYDKVLAPWFRSRGWL
jgi:hypothetical protein